MDAFGSDKDDDEDIWWYVCTVPSCYQAFTEDSRLRAHKRALHGSKKGTANVLLLSQAVDLAPRIRLTCCTGTDGVEAQAQAHVTSATSRVVEDRDREDQVGEAYPSPASTSRSKCVKLETSFHIYGDQDMQNAQNQDQVESSNSIPAEDPHELLSSAPTPTQDVDAFGGVKAEVEDQSEFAPEVEDQQPDRPDEGPELGLDLGPRLRPRLPRACVVAAADAVDPGSDDDKEYDEEDEGHKEDEHEDSPAPAKKRRVSSFKSKQQSPLGGKSLSGSHRLNKHMATVAYANAESLPRPRPLCDLITHFLRSSTCDDSLLCGVCFQLFQNTRKLRLHLYAHRAHLRCMERRTACECLHCYKEAFLRPRTSTARTATSTEAVVTGAYAWECKLCEAGVTRVTELGIMNHVHVAHEEHKPPVPPAILAPAPGGSQSEWRTAKLAATSVTSAAATKESEFETEPAPKPHNHKCGSCDKSYSTAYKLKRHMQKAHAHSSSHSNEEARTLKCDICQKELTSTRYLKKHMRLVHGSKGQLCYECGLSFKTKTGLEMHVRRHDPDPENSDFVCDVCGKPCFCIAQLNTHRQSHKMASFLCPECGKTFKTERSLRDHRRRHSNARPFRCEHANCGMSFKTKRGLQKHVSIHSERLLFPCPDPKCPRAFKSKFNCNKHVANIHVARFHICRVCAKKFPGRISLQHHEQEAHGFQRPGKWHECSHCEKKLRTLSLLRFHEKIHSMERSFKCQVEGCGKAFKTQQNLDTHRVSHLPYEKLPHVCGGCGKRFGLPHHLRAHKQRIHGLVTLEDGLTFLSRPGPWLDPPAILPLVSAEKEGILHKELRIKSQPLARLAQHHSRVPGQLISVQHQNLFSGKVLEPVTQVAHVQ